jgi:hypothetical protein
MNTKLQLLLLSFLAILAPVKGMVLITIFFIWVDLIAGIWRSKKLKLPLRSRGFARTISKTLLYAGGIVSVFFLEKYVLADLIGIFISFKEFITAKKQEWDEFKP